MLADIWLDAPAGWYPIEPGYVLKFTRIPEWLVFVITVGVFQLAAIMLADRRQRVSLIAFLSLSALFLGAMAVIGFRSLTELELLCKECHFVEWLTAALLMAAWMIGLGGIASRRWHDGPKILATFLTAGLLAGWFRELEFGKPLFGNKVIYTRNLFNIEAYVNPAYFEEFGRQLGHETPRPLQAMHWVGAAAIFTFAIVVGSYMYRHRQALGREFKSFFRTAAGRYFAAGCGLYIGTQLIGRVMERLLDIENRVVDEPLECVGAACFLMCMVSLWHVGTESALRVDHPAEDGVTLFKVEPDHAEIVADVESFRRRGELLVLESNADIA